MQITRNDLDTGAGPSDWFTGDVYIDTITAHRTAGDRRRGRPPLHPRRPDRVAHPPVRSDDLGHRGDRPLPTRRRADRSDPTWRPRLLRAWREPLARRRPDPLHDPHRHAAGRRARQRRYLGRPRQRRRLRGSAGDPRIAQESARAAVAVATLGAQPADSHARVARRAASVGARLTGTSTRPSRV